jgi:hypothetical protein
MESKGILYSAVATLFVGAAANVVAMQHTPAVLHSVVEGTFGKMNDGVTYEEANTHGLPEATAAQQLANRLRGNDHNPGMGVDSAVVKAFSAALLKTGMDAEELAFELLNWADSPMVKKKCELRTLITLDWADERKAIGVIQRIKQAADQISERNAWSRKSRESALVMSMDRLRNIDDSIRGVLTTLNQNIATVSVSHDHLRAKLVQKIQHIAAAIRALSSLNTDVGFDGILAQEIGNSVARAQALSNRLPASIHGYVPKIKLRQEREKEYTAVDAAQGAKQLLIQAINAHVIAVRNEIQLFADHVATEQKELQDLYYKIGVLAYSMSDDDPKDIFRLYGLPGGLIGTRYADDEEFRWKMYWSLPAELTDRATDERKDEYKIPQPNATSSPTEKDSHAVKNPNIPDNLKRSKLRIPRKSAESISPDWVTPLQPDGSLAADTPIDDTVL